jgi:hypothetical protein
VFTFASENIRRETVHEEGAEEERFQDEADTPVADPRRKLHLYTTSRKYIDSTYHVIIT